MIGIIAASVCVALCLAAVYRLYTERTRQRELVVRMRKSEVYGHLYPVLLKCRKRPVETVTIRPEGIGIRLLHPVGETIRCTFESIGRDNMDQEPLYALAQAVAVDLPQVREHQHYTFITHREQQPGGASWRWYEYSITTKHKDEMMRALAQARTAE